jgi:hypothetical protein
MPTAGSRSLPRWTFAMDKLPTSGSVAAGGIYAAGCGARRPVGRHRSRGRVEQPLTPIGCAVVITGGAWHFVARRITEPRRLPLRASGAANEAADNGMSYLSVSVMDLHSGIRQTRNQWRRGIFVTWRSHVVVRLSARRHAHGTRQSRQPSSHVPIGSRRCAGRMSATRSVPAQACPRI